MTFQQLHYIRQLVAHKFSVTRTADSLCTTQPSVSKVVRSLEAELGVEIFTRRGNRLIGLTDAGREAYALAGRILQDSQSLRGLQQGTQGLQAHGLIRVGTMHIHARYHLLRATERFLRVYPNVRLEYSAGSPSEISAGVLDGSIDIGLSTMPENSPSSIKSIRAYEMERCVVVPRSHPLLALPRISVQDLVRWPWIVHHDAFSTGAIVQRTFQMHGLQPRVVLRAMDVDVIKAYVAEGIGIALLQKVAMEHDNDTRLMSIEAGHIFPSSTAMVMVREGHALKRFAFDFIHILLPDVALADLSAALRIEE